MLHYCGEHKGGNERHRQGVSHCLVVFLEVVFVDVQAKATIEVKEEDTSQIVAFVDDDCVLTAQCTKVGECGTKHGVSADVVHSRFLIECLQIGLHAGNVADDAVFVQVGNDLTEHLDGVLQRDTVDDEVGVKLSYFLQLCESQRVVEESHTFGVDLIHRRFVVERQDIGKETTHLSGTQN